MGRKPKNNRVAKDARSAALEQCDNINDAAEFIKNNIHELLTAGEASIICGMSKSAFLRLSEDGRAPAGIKLERLRRWRKQEILAWIAAGCPKSKQLAKMNRQSQKDARFKPDREG